MITTRYIQKMNLSGISKIKLFLLLSLITCGVIFHNSQYADNIDMAHMAQLLEQCKNLPPILYICMLILVPVLFLPGLPFVVLGGLLYGTVWGLVYAMIGATLGAGASFLLSRYFIGNRIENIMSHSKWQVLHNMTRKHGWKIVIVLRLIPLFPYTPLNYSLGLTNIKFTHYMTATAIGIFPACYAFIFFSGSLWEILQGNGSVKFIFAALFLITILIVPLMLKKKFAYSE